MKAGSDDRRERLAAALRENLKRRKRHARAVDRMEAKPADASATAPPESRPAAAVKPV
ncbi:MAG: hypothetical protein ACREHE_15525 [Rhizomicrobium sp.]